MFMPLRLIWWLLRPLRALGRTFLRHPRVYICDCATTMETRTLKVDGYESEVTASPLAFTAWARANAAYQYATSLKTTGQAQRETEAEPVTWPVERGAVIPGELPAGSFANIPAGTPMRAILNGTPRS